MIASPHLIPRSCEAELPLAPVRAGGEVGGMCGRVVQALPADEIRRLFDVEAGALFNAPPRWNGAPTDRLMVVRRNPETGKKALDLLRWGLVPRFAKDLRASASLINARLETLAQKPAFRDAWAKKRRCLLPVDGFYEWRREGAVKQPYAIALKDRSAMALAGLWENWKDPASGEWVRSFTVLTTEANDLLKPLHERMPVIVPDADRELWLSGGEAEGLLKPLAAEAMEIWPVSTAVNKVGNEGEGLWAGSQKRG